uniref:Bm10110 n=1 Tax=Brugia malayi TaxID=6279 RepID=A0A1I9G2U4_BRUMA|nr:Bm10110 [Brugia malayi]
MKADGEVKSGKTAPLVVPFAALRSPKSSSCILWNRDIKIRDNEADDSHNQFVPCEVLSAK